MRRVMLIAALAAVTAFTVVATSSSGAAPTRATAAKATVSPSLVTWLARARVATAKYATNLTRPRRTATGSSRR